MMGIIKYFDELETTEPHEGYRFSVAETAVIIILGLLCGLENVRQIHQWASNESTLAFLGEQFGIDRVPCYFWMLCLLKIVVPESLNRCFMEWVEADIIDGKKGMTVSLDGKTVRSTAKTGGKKSPLHIVSAQLAEWGITLGQKAVDEKSNEIPAVRDLLGELELSGCIVTADALNCQKETAKKIIEKGADYLLDAKDNQKKLKTEIEEYIRDDALRSEMDRAVSREKNRERMETRTAYCINDVEWLSCRDEWSSLTGIGAIRVKVEAGGRRTEEWHYYISSKKLSAEELLRTARMEWSVETMHWLLDVHFREDYCRVLNEDAQKNLNILRKTALNIMKQYKRKTNSKEALSRIMFSCLLDSNKLIDVLSEN